MKNRMDKHSSGTPLQDVRVYYFTEPSCSEEVTRLISGCGKETQSASAGERVETRAILPDVRNSRSPAAGENGAKESVSPACFWRNPWN